jgi:rSAM/selenodomain-associated transferase 1
MANSKALLVFLKAPVPGQVKTRLIPGMTATQACDLYRSMVEDLLEQTRALAEVSVWLFCTPPSAQARVEAWLGPGWRLQPQRGADLGSRMANAFRWAFGQGHTRVVLVGTDIPGLDVNVLGRGLTALDDHDVVVGPTHDGGYYLIGLCQLHRDLFLDMEWSTAQVLTQTLARAAALSLSTDLLHPLQDVDTCVDALAVLREGEAVEDRRILGPRCAAALQRWLAGDSGQGL